MPQRTIILVRHGQTDRSKPPPDKLGNGLTALGSRQAELTGRRLADLPVTAIHHSTARRATETAEVIGTQFPGVPLQVDPVLLECIPAYPPAFVAWYSGVSGEQLSAGETPVPAEMRFWLDMWPPGTPWPVMEADVVQAAAAFDRYFRPEGATDGHEIVVCHGNIIRYFVLRSLGAPTEFWINTDINNCGLSEILVKPDGQVMLLSHNDTGHLPAELKTFM